MKGGKSNGEYIGIISTIILVITILFNMYWITKGIGPYPKDKSTVDKEIDKIIDEIKEKYV